MGSDIMMMISRINLKVIENSLIWFVPAIIYSMIWYSSLDVYTVAIFPAIFINKVLQNYLICCIEGDRRERLSDGNIVKL